MDLNHSAEDEDFRAEARVWLEKNVPPPSIGSGDTKDGFARHVEWEQKLFDARWAVVSWPEEFGGRAASLWRWLIFEEEYYRAGAPSRVTQNGIFLLAPTLFEYGTDEQKQRILRPMARAEHLWAQAWSEPGSGSDLASLKSTATRTEGGWLLNGQKTWCTRGAFCDSVFGPFRSDPELPRHKGLTYFLVSLQEKGITVRGVDRLDGDEGFAEVFFEDVFVADRDVVGEVNAGWKVAMSTTSSERGLSLRSPGRFLAAASRLVKLYQQQGRDPDPELKSRVVQAWMDAQAYHLYTLGTVTKMIDGKSIGPESSLTKVFWSEMDVELHETALDLLGPMAELDEAAPEAIDGGSWLKGYQFSLAGPIYAGTNEIQRNVVAERVLGLPRK